MIRNGCGELCNCEYEIVGYANEGITLVGDGTFGDPFTVSLVAPPAGSCSYCKTLLRLDRKGRCQHCGAPERLYPSLPRLEPDWLLMDKITV